MKGKSGLVHDCIPWSITNPDNVKSGFHSLDLVSTHNTAILKVGMPKQRERPSSGRSLSI